MLSQTISVIRRNWQFYLVVLAIGLAAIAFDEVKGKSTSGTATFFVWVLLALYVHMAVLFDTKFGELQAKGRSLSKTFLPFALKVMALTILGVVVALPVFFIPLKTSGNVSASTTLPIILFTLCALIAYALVLSLLGTWLPATVYGTGKTLLNAAKRGLPTFFPTFGRLLLGLVVLQIASIAVVAAGSFAFSSVDIIVNGMPNIPFILMITLSLFIQAFSLTYASVVLSRVYLVREGLAAIRNPAANA